jgi:hypothetical protein
MRLNSDNNERTVSASEEHKGDRWGGGRETEQNECAKGSRETEKQQTLRYTMHVAAVC